MVILVVLFVSFLFLDSRSVRNVGGHSVIKVADRTYSDKEFKTLGEGSFELVQALARSGDFGLYQFFMSVTHGATSQEDAPEKFFVGRMILRDAKEEFGIYPSQDEITAYLKSLRAFAGPDGKFSQDTYRNYIEKYIGRLGLGENDLRELASDVLVAKKLNTIIGSGLAVDRDSVAKNLALQNQQITGEVARLEQTPFEAKIEPTEEQIKTYWENIQDAFKTEEKRKFTYILVTPAALPDEAAEKPDAPETIAEAAATDEAKKAAQATKDAEKAKRSAAIAEERRKNQLKTDTLVDDFVYKLGEQKGAGFEDLAKENQWEVKTTELFPLSTPPKELDINLRASSSGGKAIDQLFRIQETSDPISKISQPLAVGENQWLVARLDGLEKSRAKTYEEARAEARAQYISEKAAEAMKAAAEEAITKIKALLTAGKSFTDAAKEAGVTEVKSFNAITSTYRPDGATEPQNLFESARTVDPGGIADVITESDRAFILYVAKREVVKEANAATRLDSEVTARTNENETLAFVSWMSNRVEAAKVEQLNRR